MNFITFHIINKLKPINYYLGGMGMPERKYSSTSQYRYGFNGKEKDNEVKGAGNQQDYGFRIYDTRLENFLSVDPHADRYPSMSGYCAFGNNPILYVDPDGRDIIISWKVGEENKTMTYSYQKDRKFEDGTPDFVKNSVMSLDQLYSKEAMKISIGEGNKAQTVDVLGKFIGNTEHNLTIVEGESNGYSPSTNTITFNHDDGATFRKDATKPGTGDNIGKNSASALLGHEIIHGYNDEFDNANYTSRKADKSTNRGGVSFSNKEEEFVTTNLANQVNVKLGQDKRTNYGRT